MIIMRGLPASGKSTKAKELMTNGGNYVRLNKDLLRTMLHFDKFTHVNERNTWNAEVALAILYLTDGMSIIIDDTNLNPKTVERWKEVAKGLNAKIEYVDMDTSVEDCIKRDAERQKAVGKHVIEKMALQYRSYLAGHKVVICDLDGTLCDISHRKHFVAVPEGQKKDWKGFFEGIPSDTIRDEVKKEVVSSMVYDNAKIVFVSARPEDYRNITSEWLLRNLGFEDYTLIMRESGDSRPDTEVKSDIYEKYLKNLQIIKVFDDRPSVIRMWKEKGLNVQDCGDGKEF